MPHRLILQKSSFEYPDFLLRRFDQGLVKRLVSPSKALWMAVAIGPGLGAAAWRANFDLAADKDPFNNISCHPVAGGT